MGLSHTQRNRNKHLCCLLNNAYDHVCRICKVGWCIFHAYDHFQGFGDGNAAHDECRPRVSYKEFMEDR